MVLTHCKYVALITTKYVYHNPFMEYIAYNLSQYITTLGTTIAGFST